MIVKTIFTESILHERVPNVARLKTGSAWQFALAAIGLCAIGLEGCGSPPVDTNQTTVTGIIEGSVQYLGRRVDCDYTNGVPTRVRGHLLMTLVDVATPLPPLGKARAPADFFALGGEDVFINPATDCLPLPADPPDPVADAAARAVTIQRVAHFRWEAIKMGTPIPASEFEPDGSISQATKDAHARHYNIQGFYDQEGDFNPLFAISRSTSAGDLTGAALDNPINPDPLLAARFRDIRFESTTVSPYGALDSTVNVTIAARVLTDPPIYRVQHGAISAESQLPFPPAVYSSYPRIDLMLYERTAPGNDARTRLDTALASLNRSGFADYSDEIAYAWYQGPVDVDRSGDAACPLGGGDKDCHPSMATFGVTWNSPIVFMQRIRSAIEIEANVPGVALIPNAGMETGDNPSAQYPAIPFRIFPFASLLPNPAHPECTASYFADGAAALIINGSAAAVPAGSVLECNELPTGFYSLSVLAGYVAAPATHVCPNPSDPACPLITSANSQTGYLVTGGQFASQSWSVPNEMGDWHQMGDVPRTAEVATPPSTCLATGDSVDPSACLPEQSALGAVIIHDPDTTNSYGRRDPAAAAANVCGAYDLSANGWADDPAREDDFNDLCCRPVMHLCDVPLCPYAAGVTPTWSSGAAEENLAMRGSPTRIVRQVRVTIEGVVQTYGVPDCIPFPIPSQCCGAGTQP